jgi:hypothetical protein
LFRVQLLPAGWTVADVWVRDGHAHITFDTQQAGSAGVVVELAASCDLTGAAGVASEQPAARRYLRIERSSPTFSATRL